MAQIIYALIMIKISELMNKDKPIKTPRSNILDFVSFVDNVEITVFIIK